MENRATNLDKFPREKCNQHSTFQIRLRLDDSNIQVKFGSLKRIIQSVLDS